MFFSALRARYAEPQGYRFILKVGLPLIAGMLSMTIMQFTDRLFLSHYSLEAISAVVPAALAFNAILFIILGTVNYTTVIIAQYVGSEAYHRVGPALWQGIWCAVIGGTFMGSLWFLAEPLFAMTGASPRVQELEVLYFRVLCLGSVVVLLNSVLGCFFSGRAQTRPVFVANMVAAIVKIPTDYLLIFGGFGIPSLGVLGAGIATGLSAAVGASILAFCIFTKHFEKKYNVRSGWPLKSDMLKRLFRFGLPSGFNMFMDMVAISWFSFKVSSLADAAALPASNIALSLNQPIFVPMLGLNFAVASLVGQSMGAGKPEDVERIVANSVHLAALYMIPMALCMAIFSGQLMDLFADPNLTQSQFEPVRNIGKVLLYYIAIYSLVDSLSIINFGALKGAGDTKGIMILLLIGLFVFLGIPFTAIDVLGKEGVHSYWITLTVYIIFLAFASTFRFKLGRWKMLRVVETAKIGKNKRP